MQINNTRQYNQFWEILDRVIVLEESGRLEGDDLEWVKKTRNELYDAISDYNQYNAEYKSGHSYGEKK